jgi:hypothetical protein
MVRAVAEKKKQSLRALAVIRIGAGDVSTYTYHLAPEINRPTDVSTRHYGQVAPPWAPRAASFQAPASPTYDVAARRGIELLFPLMPLPKDFPNDTERATAMFRYNEEQPKK